MYFHQKTKIHRLIGDLEQSLYSLGLSDKNFLTEQVLQLSNILKTGNKVVDEVLDKAILLMGALESNLKDKDPELSKLIQFYCEGLDIDRSQFYKGMLYPDIMTSIAQFLPLNILQFGCSSVFHCNQKGEALHLRVLDFPLHQLYTKSERFLVHSFGSEFETFSIGPKGLPLHSLTAMNSHGLSMAIHQKFSREFNLKGLPIFIIAHKLITKAKTLEEVKQLATKLQAIGSWGINFSDQHSNILSLEYSGNKLTFKERKLLKGEFYYFNNQLLEGPRPKAIPASIEMYNEVREDFFSLLEDKLQSQSIDYNEISLIKETQRASAEIYKKKNKLFSFFTPSTVQIACFNLSKKTACLVEGDSPKNAKSGLIQIEKIFEKTNIKYLKDKYSPAQLLFQKGQQALMDAQFQFDKGNTDLCYHNLQMSIDYLEKSNYSIYPKFYFAALNCFFLKDRKSQLNLLDQFDLMREKLPKYLSEHCLLFQLRLNKILNLEGNNHTIIHDKNLTNPVLKGVWSIEKELPSWALQSFLQKMSKLRVDIYDIIYLHSQNKY